MQFVVNISDLSSILLYNFKNKSIININNIKANNNINININITNDKDNDEDKDEDFLDILYNTTRNSSFFNKFNNNKTVGFGNRLGVPYMRAQQTEVDIIINNELYVFNQSSLGLTAISGVLWDAGILLTDFLIHYTNLYNKYQLSLNNNIVSPSLKLIDESLMKTDEYLTYFKHLSIRKLGSVLDIGCGIGIAGITALLLNCDSLTLTDCTETDCLNINIDKLLFKKKSEVNFIQYDWTSNDIPSNLLTNNNNDLIWDTVICSDVLYDEKNHIPFFNFIQNLKFNRLILSYKKRYLFNIIINIIFFIFQKN